MLTAPPSLADFAGLSGSALIAVVYALLVVEEVGIPLFLAPDDQLLVMSGASIPAAHLTPLLIVAAKTASVRVGALAGRELFAVLETAAVSRIAGFFHVGAGLDRLAARVGRGGAGAVFVGRITPGLRVLTMEVAGLVRMRRAAVLAGLVPALGPCGALALGPRPW